MDTKTTNDKIATSVRIDPDVYNAVAELREQEGRPSQANMIERLIETHPRVKTFLKLQAEQTAGAGA